MRPEDAKFGLRIRGGVRFDLKVGKFYAAICLWCNPRAEGEPDEWRDAELFDTEAQAMAHYEKKFAPILQHIHDMLQTNEDVTAFFHRHSKDGLLD